MFATRSKKILMACLVAAFGIQTFLVHADSFSMGDTPITLTGEALRGRRLWHQHNCQSCHQLYGFGGFLGPDLTNASPRLGDARLSLVLTQGSNAMPAFHMSAQDIGAVRAFLDAMDQTGIGQARIPPPPGADEWAGTTFEPFYRAVGDEMSATGPSANVRAGFALYQRNSCQTCHYPLAESPIQAPDLSLHVRHHSNTYFDEILEKGKPGTAMPPSGFDADERAQVIAFLRWMGDRRDALGKRLEGTEPRPLVWSEIPWWEYR
jgi:nitric oxide reductase subunit C